MNDSLGDRMKQFESLTESKLMSHLPIICRIDGRAFHTFTKGLKRPYDERLSNMMSSVTRYLIGEFNPKVGYTQSDEISLLFWQKDIMSEMFFGGRVQKITSVLASATTAWFNKYLDLFINEKRHSIVTFDCRVFQVNSQTEAYNYFIWRERDAIKNSIQMAAQCNFSHKELQGKNGSIQQEMLFQKGINWNDYPPFFKRGIFIKNVAYQPSDGFDVVRHCPEVLNVEDLSKMRTENNIESGIDFLFRDCYNEVSEAQK